MKKAEIIGKTFHYFEKSWSVIFELNEQSEISDNINRQAKQKDRKGGVVSVNRKYVCEQCHKTYSSEGALCMHKQSEHQAVRYSCNQCDYQAKYKGHLTAHIQSIHEGVKYACNQCDKRYTTQSDLKVHFRVKHKGVKYACNQCNYQATRKSNIVRHIKTAHEDSIDLTLIRVL